MEATRKGGFLEGCPENQTNTCSSVGNGFTLDPETATCGKQMVQTRLSLER